MPALNFRAEFADAVERGEKCQTIRAYRKDGRNPKPGDTLHLYTGMRTRACRLLAVRRCTAVKPVLIVESYALVAGETLEGDALERFAKADGFDGWSDMSRWFERTHGLPFHGLAIYWGQSRENVCKSEIE